MTASRLGKLIGGTRAEREKWNLWCVCIGEYITAGASNEIVRGELDEEITSFSINLSVGEYFGDGWFCWPGEC